MISQTDLYDADPHVPELYDASETGTDDLVLIRKLVGERSRLRITEPFCGTGRLAVPLALDGHFLTGLDSSSCMLAAARAKAEALSPAIASRLSFVRMNVLTEAWPKGNDLVILGGNCLYELAAPDDQRACIRAASKALKSGGYLYVDNDHMEGKLADSWKETKPSRCFPSGRCQDGTALESTMQAIWFDDDARLVRFRRHTRVFSPDGSMQEVECIQQKHPVSALEIEGWLSEAGFQIRAQFGDYVGGPYTAASDRAIFWAVKIDDRGSPDLCTQCGLCCQGVVHSHAALDTSELDLAQELSFRVDTFEDGLGFHLPCPQYQGDRCTSYQHRPRSCVDYQCELLQRFLTGEVSLEESLSLIAQAKVMLEKVWAQLPGGKATPIIFRTLRAIVGKESSAPNP